MTERRAELVKLTERLVDAFNRMSLDEVVSLFASDAIYEDPRGNRCKGHAEIRKSLEPLLGGSFEAVRFTSEDTFVEEATGKVLASWRVVMKKGGELSAMRGLDVLEFAGDKLTKKFAYLKGDKPHMEEITSGDAIK